MKTRCLNPRFRDFGNYGGRGILICEKWVNSFAAFVKDMGKKPTARMTLERIDNNGNYEPSNCKWATYKEQINNKRTSVKVLYAGRKVPISELSEMAGMQYGVLYTRIMKMGWTVKRALSTPVRPRQCFRLLLKRPNLP